MSQTQSNFPTKTPRKTTSLQRQSANSNPTDQKMYKTSAIAKIDAAKMAAYAPAEIGTRGTVGSLIMKEIDDKNTQEEKEGHQAPTKHMFYGGRCRQQSSNWDFCIQLQESKI
ncbi:hypothetical protein M0R45_015160 [Rubus argutus]|uniref:Uncharacterized protein n=1 Tax=Rubus argutus TaxID=59490 RepID=A0AAW1XPY6_RUBAR